MADLSSNSEKEDSDVDAIISQAKDLVVLEQVSSINLSGFSHDSVLPTDLESRFRKLKSFPETKSKHQSQHPNQTPPTQPKTLAENPQFQEPKKGELGGDPDFATQTPKSTSRSISKSISSPSVSGSVSSSDSRSGSPNREAACCFWRSPKRASSRKKSRVKKDRGLRKLDLGKIESGDLGVLADLNAFTEKERKRSMKRLLKEEEKINREAEKIVRWAKRESARMNGMGSENIGDEFEIGSEDENLKR